jgi:hypothetical protein
MSLSGAPPSEGENQMKKYTVELKYTLCKQFEVEANSEEQAERLAWEQLKREDYSLNSYGDWTCDSIEESQP